MVVRARFERLVAVWMGLGGLLGGVIGLAGRAQAQEAPGAGALPPAGAQAPEGTNPGAAEDTPALPVRAATGYGYGTAKQATARRTTASRAAKVSPVNVVTLPGFAMTEEGGSRLLVHMTGAPEVEEKRAAGSVTYVIRGARVLRRNNRNALETAHFNTPVLRARLVSRGRDLHFVVDLRKDVAPSWRLADSAAVPDPSTASRAGKAGAPAGPAGKTLVVEFAQGEYLPPGHADEAMPKSTPHRAPASRASDVPGPLERAKRTSREPAEPLPDILPEGDASSRGAGPEY